MGKIVFTERLTPIIILDARPAEKYSLKIQVLRDPNLSVEDIVNTMKTIFMNHFEK